MRRAFVYMKDGSIDWVDPVEEVSETDEGDLVINNGVFTYVYERADYDRYEIAEVEEQ